MRSLVWSVACVAGLWASSAAAEPVKPSLGCEVVADRVASVLGVPRAVDVIAVHCEQDHWPSDARGCFANAATPSANDHCLDLLSRDQQRKLAAESPRLAQWIHGRPMPTSVTFASYVPSRALHDQGVAAYQRGEYQLAVRKLTAAYDTRPSPELVYHLAQAYRREGQWTAAVDLYVKYLELAPNGAAAADCRRELELLRD